jgi:hypothetical protein
MLLVTLAHVTTTAASTAVRLGHPPTRTHAAGRALIVSGRVQLFACGCVRARIPTLTRLVHLRACVVGGWFRFVFRVVVTAVARALMIGCGRGGHDGAGNFGCYKKIA